MSQWAWKTKFSAFLFCCYKHFKIEKTVHVFWRHWFNSNCKRNAREAWFWTRFSCFRNFCHVKTQIYTVCFTYQNLRAPTTMKFSLWRCSKTLIAKYTSLGSFPNGLLADSKWKVFERLSSDNSFCLSLWKRVYFWIIQIANCFSASWIALLANKQNCWILTLKLLLYV